MAGKLFFCFLWLNCYVHLLLAGLSMGVLNLAIVIPQVSLLNYLLLNDVCIYFFVTAKLTISKTLDNIEYRRESTVNTLKLHTIESVSYISLWYHTAVLFNQGFSILFNLSYSGISFIVIGFCKNSWPLTTHS